MLTKIGKVAVFGLIAVMVMSAGCVATKSQLDFTETRMTEYTNDGLDKLATGIEGVGEAVTRVDQKANQAQATAEAAAEAAKEAKAEAAKATAIAEAAKSAKVTVEVETEPGTGDSNKNDSAKKDDRKSGEGAMLPPKELKYFARGTHIANIQTTPNLNLKRTESATINFNQRNASVGDFKGMMDMVGFNPTEGTSFTRGYEALNFHSGAKFRLKGTNDAVINYNQAGAEINPGSMTYVWDRKKSVYTKGFKALNYENTKKFNVKGTKDAVIIVEDLDVVPSDQQ